MTAAGGKQAGGAKLSYNVREKKLDSTNSRDGKRWVDSRSVQQVKSTVLALGWIWGLNERQKLREMQVSDPSNMCSSLG